MTHWLRWQFRVLLQASTIAGTKSILSNCSRAPPRRRKQLRNCVCRRFWLKSRKDAITWCCGWIVTRKARTFASRWWTPFRDPFEMCIRIMWRTEQNSRPLPKRTSNMRWPIWFDRTKMRLKVLTHAKRSICVLAAHSHDSKRDSFRATTAIWTRRWFRTDRVRRRHSAFVCKDMTKSKRSNRKHSGTFNWRWAVPRSLWNGHGTAFSTRIWPISSWIWWKNTKKHSECVDGQSIGREYFSTVWRFYIFAALRVWQRKNWWSHDRSHWTRWNWCELLALDSDSDRIMQCKWQRDYTRKATSAIPEQRRQAIQPISIWCETRIWIFVLQIFHGLFAFPMDFSGVVKLLQPSSEFGEDAREIASNFNSPRKGTDCGDHPPITPMKLMRKEWNV